MMRDDPSRVIEIAKALDIGTLYIPFLEPNLRPKDAKGWADIGHQVAEIGKPIRDAGISLGWHNHEFEFEDIGGGELPIDHIMSADGELELEFDVAWAIKVGADPMVTIKKYGWRISAAHLKDIAPEGTCEDEDGWADLGHGTVSWDAYFKALKNAGTRHFIVEHDNPGDHHRFAQRSIISAQNL